MKFFKNKKSVELTMSAIIIAVLALVALIVMIAIFSNSTGKVSQNLGSCEAKGGKCANEFSDGACNSEYPISIVVSNCESAKNKCCIKIIN